MKRLLPILLMSMAVINPSVASEKEVEFSSMHPLPPPPPPSYQYGDAVIRYEVPSVPTYTVYGSYGSMEVQDVGGTHTPIFHVPSAPASDDIAILYETARMTASGEGAAKDVRKAVDMFQQCIAAGHAKAHFALGLLYQEGRDDLPVDFNEAFRLFTLGTALNEPHCMTSLAIMHLLPLVGEKNPYRAYELLNMAANLEHAPAKYNLARMYYIGDGIPKNKSLARRLVKESAQKGFAPALDVLKRSCCGYFMPF